MKATLDNLLAWRAVTTVAKTGSISVAASMLDLDPPMVSHLVADIEREMQVKILDRSRRPFRLTPQGQTLVSRLEPLLRDFASIEEMFSDNNHHIITVAAPTDLNQCYFHDDLFQYSVKHPNVDFYLSASCPVEDVLSGRVDVAMIDRPISHPDLVVRFCIEASPIPLAAKGYVKRYGMPETIEDLKHHTGLLLRQGMHQRTSYLYDQAGRVSSAIKWKRVFMTDAQLTLNHMMREELGIVIDCALLHLADDIREGSVVPVLRGWKRKPQILSIVTRRDREETSDIVHDFAVWWCAHAKRRSLKLREQTKALIGSIV